MNLAINAIANTTTVIIPNARPLTIHVVMMVSISKSKLATFQPHVWRHQFCYGTRRKAARGSLRRSLHLARGGGYGARPRRLIARTSHDAWRTPCRTQRNARWYAVLRSGGLFCIPCASIRSATGSPAYGLSLGSGSAFRAFAANERRVCSAGMTRPSMACRIWGTSS